MRAKADLALPREGEVKRLDEPPEGGRINRPPWAMLLLSSTALHCGRAAPTELRHCGGGGHFRGGTYAAGSAPFLSGRAKPGFRSSSAGPRAMRRMEPIGTIRCSPSTLSVRNP